MKSIVQASIHIFRAWILNGRCLVGDGSVPMEDSWLWMLKFADPLCTSKRSVTDRFIQRKQHFRKRFLFPAGFCFLQFVIQQATTVTAGGPGKGQAVQTQVMGTMPTAPQAVATQHVVAMSLDRSKIQPKYRSKRARKLGVSTGE